MKALKLQSQKGKPILGICNGAQILVETGLVPGLENEKIGMALTENKRVRAGQVLGTGYYNAWVNLRLPDGYQHNAFTRKLTPEDILHVPVAHAEGRFLITPGLLQEIAAHGLQVFQYCDDKGNISAEFPVNPNGSVNNIAAISNKAGNVMAIMPHPERTPNGDAIFHSMREYIAENFFSATTPMSYYPRFPDRKKFTKDLDTHEWIVELIITDNQAVTVQNALHHSKIPVEVTRQIHWEIQCDQATLAKIKESGVLFNPRKEILRSREELSKSKKFLVRQKENILGQEKLQMLKHHFNLENIHSIKQGVLWHVTAKHDDDIKHVINSHILFNPYAYDCYDY